jgi:hypothetical protein
VCVMPVVRANGLFRMMPHVSECVCDIYAYTHTCTHVHRGRSGSTTANPAESTPIAPHTHSQPPSRSLHRTTSTGGHTHIHATCMGMYACIFKRIYVYMCIYVYGFPCVCVCVLLFSYTYCAGILTASLTACTESQTHWLLPQPHSLLLPIVLPAR